GQNPLRRPDEILAALAVSDEELDRQLLQAFGQHADGGDLRVRDLNRLAVECAQLRRRRETSSTTPCSSSVGIAIESPTAYQRSTNIIVPAITSISTRWIANPARMITNEAPASVVSLFRPPVSCAAERTIATAKAAYAIAA